MLRSGQPITGQWQHLNRLGQRGQFQSGEIISARDAIESRRSRTLLGGASGMQLSQPLMEYDMTQAYGGQTWVHVGADNDAVTMGTIDPDSGLLVYSVPGWYCSGAAGVPLTTEDGSPAYYIPQVPLPDPTDIDSSENYWVIFVADSQCY
jgi:hypothetical protein